MDKKPYVSQMQSMNEPSTAASGNACEDGAAELPHSFNQMDFQAMKAIKDLTKALKMDARYPDLLRTLCLLEGELQARDIVIAVLKVRQIFI